MHFDWLTVLRLCQLDPGRVDMDLIGIHYVLKYVRPGGRCDQGRRDLNSKPEITDKA